MGETTTPILYSGQQIDAIRERLKAVMDTEELRPQEVSRLADMGYATLVAWLSGKYIGRQDLQAQKIEKWLESRTIASRTRSAVKAPSEFVLTKSAGDYFALFQTAQYLPDFVMITGAPGVGKTMAAKAYAAQTPNVFLATAEPCHRTVRMFLDTLCHVLGLGAASGGEKASRQITHRLKGTGGLLIIDEAQHLSSEIMDQVRTLHDRAEVGVALLGNERVVTRIDGFARDTQYAQLHSRVGARLRRAKPLVADIDALVAQWGIEGEAEKRLLRVLGQKPGGLRGMNKCLRLAMLLAQGEPIQDSNIMAAWGQLGNEVSAVRGGN